MLFWNKLRKSDEKNNDDGRGGINKTRRCRKNNKERGRSEKSSIENGIFQDSQQNTQYEDKLKNKNDDKNHHNNIETISPVTTTTTTLDWTMKILGSSFRTDGEEGRRGHLDCFMGGGDYEKNYSRLLNDLGPGPMRFAPREQPKGIVAQISSLNKRQVTCFTKIRERWETLHPDMPFTNEMYLRFCQCCPGNKSFEEETAWKVMVQFDHHYLSLTAEILEAQLLTKTLFPLPGLKTLKDEEVFYMRPSRFFPKCMSTEDLIDNLAYVIQTMNDTSPPEQNSERGLAFLANMKDWKLENFDMQYCNEFMRMLQGHTIPVRVELFLIVDPPSWFGVIWNAMKPMLSRKFRKKVHMIPSKKLSNFLVSGFQKYLPNDGFASDNIVGMADTESLVRDFILYRKRVEEL